jgi:hypothetical protein
MSKYLLVLVFLLGCDRPLTGHRGGYCYHDLTCEPGLQCQMTRTRDYCVPMGVAK